MMFDLITVFLFVVMACLTDGKTPSPSSIGRFQYHQQGLNGAHPVSYRFGFISDNSRNPLSRHEVSVGPGHVIGAYSYIDANKKWQIVQYEAHPKSGFRIVKQMTHQQQNSENPNSS